MESSYNGHFGSTCFHGPGRAALVKQLNDLYVQGYYEIPLVNRGIVSAHLNTLMGVRINGWDSELWNIADWRR